MKIPFRQGIVRAQTPTFLQKTGTGVNLLTNNSPLVVSFTHGESEYNRTEASNVTGLWSGIFPTGQDYWLYLDLDVLTAERTAGYTTLPPVVSDTAPTSPVNDQHWFDTTAKKHKVWNY